MHRHLMLIDPLTLIGREFLGRLEELGQRFTVEYRHTDEDDEHQIAELGGEPALVPPLDDPSELDPVDLVVLLSQHATPRLDRLERWLADRPHARVLDVGRHPSLRDLTLPSAGAIGVPSDAVRLRVAHPALVACAAIERAFELAGSNAAT